MPPKKGELPAVKHYIVDTNVLLHDPQSIFQFEENVVWIPVEVLEELDRFKAETTTRGANAREVHRSLSARFGSAEKMKEGVPLENGGRLHVCINPAVKFEHGEWHLLRHSERFDLVRSLFPDFATMDNRILATAAFLADTQSQEVIMVTKDLNMQLKARALGLDAQDYRTDRVDDSDIPRTQRTTAGEDYATLDISGHALQSFASQEEIVVAGTELPQNAYVLIRNEEEHTHAIPARHLGAGRFVKLRHDTVSIRNGRTLKAANLGQRFFLDALFDPDLTLITVYGKAGTGKTLLSVGAALQQVQEAGYEKMLITRVIMPTGRDIGFLPGRMEEKMQPWVQPSFDALELLMSRPRKPEQFADKKQSARKNQPHSRQTPAPHGGGGAGGGPKSMRPWEPLMQSGVLEVEAITHIRGRSLPHAIFIVDEAQQLTPHEAKTLVTRMGRGSKIILIGDLAQIDNPYVDAHTNGLVFTRNRLQGQPFMAHVNLFKGERSEMAEVAANLM